MSVGGILSSMLQDPAKEHVEVLHDRPGFCPECLERYITARGGGKVQLVARDGKWVCPRSGKTLAQEFGPDTSVSRPVSARSPCCQPSP